MDLQMSLAMKMSQQHNDVQAHTIGYQLSLKRRSGDLLAEHGEYHLRPRLSKQGILDE